MLRASHGEVVEYRDLDGDFWTRCNSDPSWDWQCYAFRILEFPTPPKGEEWHNPHKLTATQVGVHEGWRLLLRSEVNLEMKDAKDGSRADFYRDGRWFHVKNDRFTFPLEYSYRTKAPLPKPKPSSEKAMELAQKETGWVAPDCGYGEDSAFCDGWGRAISWAKEHKEEL